MTGPDIQTGVRRSPPPIPTTPTRSPSPRNRTVTSERDTASSKPANLQVTSTAAAQVPSADAALASSTYRNPKSRTPSLPGVVDHGAQLAGRGRVTLRSELLGARHVATPHGQLQGAQRA